MKHEIKSDNLCARAVQLIPSEEGALLKRGCTELHIQGERALEVVETILLEAAGSGASRAAITELFAAPDREAIEQLIDQLIERRVLFTAADEEEPGGEEEQEESRVDVFYWEFGAERAQVESRLAEWEFLIIGVNTVSTALASSLLASGCPAPQVVDFPLLRNLDLYDPDSGSPPRGWPEGMAGPADYEAWEETYEPADGQCLVLTSDFGGLASLREWNRFAVDNEVHFLPVVLQNMIGYVGPLVVPGETPCFECLLARQNSHRDDAATSRRFEEAAFQSQSLASLHPSAATLVAELAALELLKLYGGRLPSWRVGELLEFQVLVPALERRRLLKVPRCPVCSPLHKHSASSTDRFVLRGPVLDA